MNKIELTYRIEGYKTLTYNIDDSIYQEYLDYCENNNMDSTSSSTFIRFLYESGIEFYEDIEITDEILDDYTHEVFKFIEKANDIKRNQAEVSGNNSEAE